MAFNAGVTRLIVFCLIAIDPQLAEVHKVYLIRSGPVFISANVSSSVFNETCTGLGLKCLARCAIRGCAVASLNRLSGLCQLVVLTGAPEATGPPSNVARLVGAAVGDLVWKVADFEDQLKLKATQVITFSNSSTGRLGSVQIFIAPVAGCYLIHAFGARGGNSPGNLKGGDGALISGSFSLAFGTKLKIVVGQRGGDTSQGLLTAGSGGGGGTFVYTSPSNNLLLAAGGGGGSSGCTPGQPGQSATAGSDTTPCLNCTCTSTNRGVGGTNGSAGGITAPGTDGEFDAGAGAGWLGTSSITPRSTSDGESGGSRADGWFGGHGAMANAGAVGGFGGGGGGAESIGSSGGGGGFSGGGATYAANHPGGGGGSFCGGISCTGATGGNMDREQGHVMVIAGNACG